MKKNKEKRNKENQTPSSVPSLKSAWLRKRPVILFVSGYVVLMGLFYWIYLSPFFIRNIQPLIFSLNTHLASFILNLLGQNTNPSGEMIRSSATSLSVRHGCDAVEAMALFVSALLVFPARWKWKMAGAFAGIAILFIFNLFRIVSLFFTEIFFPKAFNLMHVEIWQVVFIFFALGLWLLWMQKAVKVKPHAES